MVTAGSSLQTLLLWLREQRFTGTLTLHVAGGVPRLATWGAPNQVHLDTPTRALSATPLDTSQPPVAVSAKKS